MLSPDGKPQVWRPPDLFLFYQAEQVQASRAVRENREAS